MVSRVYVQLQRAPHAAQYRIILTAHVNKLVAWTMSSSGPPLIAPKVHECVRRFSALSEADQIARPALVDQLGRLKIWAGNIGAFQDLPLQSSLDYRLREAPKIVDQVIELLNDLNETLQEGMAISQVFTKSA